MFRACTYRKMQVVQNGDFEVKALKIKGLTYFEVVIDFSSITTNFCIYHQLNLLKYNMLHWAGDR